jgi:predicted phage baseplate assembly protein
MLPEVVLDDRRFQELVSEARTRIALSCPEWTEHNVSDPGITLIELFAWMTEMLIYRVNRIPEKLHVELLNLLGIRLGPPSCASTEIRFSLGGPAEERIEIPAPSTEIATLRTADEPAIVFQVRESFTIPPLRPAAYAMQRGGEIKDVGVADGHARPVPADQTPFGTPPQPGDALFIGFDEPISRLMVRVDVDGSEARGAGVDPLDPPLRWEIWIGDATWLDAPVLEDTTGGFNLGSGSTTIQVPPGSAIQSLAGHRMHWLRCRIAETTRSGKPGTAYTHPPVIRDLTASTVGALLPAIHAGTEDADVLGISEGLPGASFTLRHQPVLAPSHGETLEVREPGSKDWRAWEVQESFAGSGRDDRHFVLDLAHGEVELGPSIRQPDGSWRQYGAIPPKGSEIRFSRYRYGGGRTGNVSANKLSVLKSAVPGVASVTNPRPASGGVDGESLESARARAALEFRTRYRAVTAKDYEFLSVNASPRVARAYCPTNDNGNPTRVYLLPRVEPADRRLTLEELTPTEELFNEVGSYLDERRVIGTTVELLPTRIYALSVVTNVQAAANADLARVEADVARALYRFLNPLIGGSVSGDGAGWPHGRALNQGELFGVVHAIRGVELVKILRVYEADLATGKQGPQPIGPHIELASDQVIASGPHVVRVDYAHD